MCNLSYVILGRKGKWVRIANTLDSYQQSSLFIFSHFLHVSAKMSLASLTDLTQLLAIPVEKKVVIREVLVKGNPLA